MSSPGAPHLSYSTPATTAPPRRFSYASVAAGTPIFSADSSNSLVPSTRSYSSSGPVPSVHLPRAPSSDRPSRTPHPVSGPDPDAEISIDRSISRRRGVADMTNSARPQSTSERRQLDWGSMHGGFFRPSYMRGSTYMEHLEAAHEYRMSVLEEDPSSTRPYNPASPSPSGSHVSLPKMAPSHRGMTYDIIENSPSTGEDGPKRLPSRWTHLAKGGGLDVGQDGVEIRFVGQTKLPDHEAAAARTNHPMPRECGLYYFEVTVVSKGKEGMIGVGFSGTKASLDKLPGWDQDSWAYHGDDGMSFCCQMTGKPYGPLFTTGDVIGCGVNFLTKQAFFTKNGVFLGYAFREVKDIPLYPSVGMKRPYAHLQANFGQMPFIYDIDGMVRRIQLDVSQDIESADISNLSPDLGRSDLCRALIAQYLAHDGYNETAKAFAREVRSERTNLMQSQNHSNSPLEPYLAVDEDHDASQRQQIRAAILSGLIDKAISLTEQYYPGVLSERPQEYFLLRCRKFVEMFRLITEQNDIVNGVVPRSQTKRSKTGSLNGHRATTYSDYENEMDVDEDSVTPTPNKSLPQEVEDEVEEEVVDDDEDDQMDDTGEDGAALPSSKNESNEQHQRQQQTSRATAQQRLNELWAEAMIYGQDLRQRFKEDQSRLVTDTMTDIFGMLAHKDPRTSERAHLLDESERIPIAEAVNSAILVSIGRSPTTALERVYKQTVVMTDLLAEDGGVGAFVNVRNIISPGPGGADSSGRKGIGFRGGVRGGTGGQDGKGGDGEGQGRDGRSGLSSPSDEGEGEGLYDR